MQIPTTNVREVQVMLSASRIIAYNEQLLHPYPSVITTGFHNPPETRPYQFLFSDFQLNGPSDRSHHKGSTLCLSNQTPHSKDSRYGC